MRLRPADFPRSQPASLTHQPGVRLPDVPGFETGVIGLADINWASGTMQAGGSESYNRIRSLPQIPKPVV
jgi:hypothetical protein